MSSTKDPTMKMHDCSQFANQEMCEAFSTCEWKGGDVYCKAKWDIKNGDNFLENAIFECPYLTTKGECLADVACEWKGYPCVNK